MRAGSNPGPQMERACRSDNFQILAPAEAARLADELLHPTGERFAHRLLFATNKQNPLSGWVFHSIPYSLDGMKKSEPSHVSGSKKSPWNRGNTPPGICS